MMGNDLVSSDNVNCIKSPLLIQFELEKIDEIGANDKQKELHNIVKNYQDLLYDDRLRKEQQKLSVFLIE